MEEWLARGGRLRAAVTLGFPFGLVLGGTWFAFARSADAVSGGVASGVVGALVFGALAALTRWEKWPRGGQLSPPDRAAVVRAVYRGEPVLEPRLVPDVLSYAETVLAAAKREQRPRWMIFAFPVLALALAVAETVAGSARPAVYSWAITAFFLSFAVLLLRSAARKQQNAAVTLLST